MSLTELLSEHRPGWMRDAACAEHDPAIFFPTRGMSLEPARRICADCLVRVECLNYALSVGRDCPGVWGGTSDRDRRRIRNGQPASERSYRFVGRDPDKIAEWRTLRAKGLSWRAIASVTGHNKQTVINALKRTA